MAPIPYQASFTASFQPLLEQGVLEGRAFTGWLGYLPFFLCRRGIAVLNLPANRTASVCIGKSLSQWITSIFFCSLEGKVVISNYFFSFRQVNMI